MDENLNVVRVHVPTFQDYTVVVEDGSGVEFKIVFKDGEYTIEKITTQVANS